MEISPWAMFVRFARRVFQLLEIKTLWLLEWNLFFPCILEVFGSPVAYKQHMVFTQESYGKSKKHRTQPRDLGYLGVRVSTWLMANAKQYLICRICAIYFWPARSYFKQQTWSVMSCSSSRGERLFLCNEKWPCFIRVVDDSYKSLGKGCDGPW